MTDQFGKPVLHARKGWAGRTVCEHRQFWTDGLWVLWDGKHRPSWHTADSLRPDPSREPWSRYTTAAVIPTPMRAPLGVFGLHVRHSVSSRVGHVVSAQRRHSTDGVWVMWTTWSKAPSWHPVDALRMGGLPYSFAVDPDDLPAQLRAAQTGAIA